MYISFLENRLKKLNEKDKKPYDFERPVWVNDFLKDIDLIIDEWNSYRLKSNFGTPIDELSDVQKHLNTDKKWKSVLLYVYSYFNKKEIESFPKLKKLVQKHQHSLNLVLFSTTEAGKHILPHRGSNFGVLRLQIGIDIKYPNDCCLRVEDKKVFLKEKEVFIFDDTFTHEIANNSQSYRTVLIIDYFRPYPWIYDKINRFLVKKKANSGYVQSVVKKINEPC